MFDIYVSQILRFVKKFSKIFSKILALEALVFVFPFQENPKKARRVLGDLSKILAVKVSSGTSLPHFKVRSLNLLSLSRSLCD